MMGKPQPGDKKVGRRRKGKSTNWVQRSRHSAKVNGAKNRRRQCPPEGDGRRGKRSWIWRFFSPCSPHPNGAPRASCRLCGATYKILSGTSGIRIHMRKSHPDEGRRSEPGSGLVPVVGGGSAPEGVRAGVEIDPPPPILLPFDHDDDDTNERRAQSPGLPEVGRSPKEKMLRETVSFMTSNLMPLYRVNEDVYKDVVCRRDPRYNQFFTDGNILASVTQTLEQVYQEVKQSVRLELCNKYVSIWVNVCILETEVFAMVTANFVSDEWLLSKRFLGMRSLGTILNGREPSQIQISNQPEFSTLVGALLEEFGIDSGKVTRIVLNSLPFQATSRGVTPTMGLHRPVWTCLTETVRRCRDSLNRVIRDVTGRDVLHACHQFGKEYFLRSDYEEMEDQPSRLLTEVRQAILDSGGNDLAEKQLVEDINAFNIIQEPIAELIDVLLRGSVISVSVLLPLMFALRRSYESQPALDNAHMTTPDKNRVVRGILESIEAGYQVDLESNDLGNSDLVLCTFLDPRYKMLQYFSQSQRQNVMNAVLGLLGERSAPPDPTPSRPNKLLAFISMAGRGHQRSDSKIEQELSKYLEEPPAPFEEDVLQWWSNNQERFPVLSVIAKKYLCVVVEATPAEFCFTEEGEEEREGFFQTLALIEPEHRDKMLFLEQNEKS